MEQGFVSTPEIGQDRSFRRVMLKRTAAAKATGRSGKPGGAVAEYPSPESIGLSGTWGTWPAEVRPTAIRRRWFEKLRPLPAGLDLEEIAGRLREPYHTVYRWAQFFRYPFPDRRSWKPSIVDWTRADWTKRDSDIARTLGVSRERVRQIRQRNGIARASTPIRRFEQFVAEQGERLGTMTVQQAVEESGEQLCLSAGRHVLRLAGITAARRSEHRKLDWRLPNRDLASIWGLSGHYVATLRLRLRAGPAKWDLHGGATIDDAAYRNLLRAEKLNARRAASFR